MTRRIVWLWSVGFARAGGRLLQPFIDVIEAAGLSTPEPVDLGTALWTGLASQQISKDPGGQRWRRLIDRPVDLLVDRPTAAESNRASKARAVSRLGPASAQLSLLQQRAWSDDDCDDGRAVPMLVRMLPSSAWMSALI